MLKTDCRLPLVSIERAVITFNIMFHCNTELGNMTTPSTQNDTGRRRDEYPKPKTTLVKCMYRAGIWGH